MDPPVGQVNDGRCLPSPFDEFKVRYFRRRDRSHQFESMQIVSDALERSLATA